MCLDLKFLVFLSEDKSNKQKFTDPSVEPSFPQVSKAAFSFLLGKVSPSPCALVPTPSVSSFIHSTNIYQYLCTRHSA